MRVTGLINGRRLAIELCHVCASKGATSLGILNLDPRAFQEGEEELPEGRKGASATPTLDRYAMDLSAAAANGKLDPVVGRERELERLVRILVRKTKNNPVLVGEPGVGKTAVVEGLAQRIHSNTVPEPLQGKRVLTLDLAGMLAGSKLRGEFEERLKSAIDEIRAQAGRLIVFIDELHTVVGAGAAEGAMDAGNILKPALARGELRVIGATTLDEYRKHIEKDAALERRFQPVQVDEPTPEQARAILAGLRGAYETHHQVTIEEASLDAAVDFGIRYVNDRFLPDKAIDLLDEACAMVRLASESPYEAERALIDRLASLEQEKKAAVEAERFTDAARLQQEIAAGVEQLKALKARASGGGDSRVTPAHIARVVSEWTGIPAGKIGQEDAAALLGLESRLAERVVGQSEAIQAIARAVRRSRAGLKDEHRPIGSFIFLGPTGVGKTELAKALARELFHDGDALIRIDMSEFGERHTAARLVGAPPGYVGYDEAGQLTEAIRRKPYSVVLFDEIEKAHPDVHQLLLQIMEDGRLTDGHGKTVDFRHALVIMTSNVGASKLVGTQSGIGFQTETGGAEAARWERMKGNALEALKAGFKPEFLNRVDDVIVFRPLGESEILSIVDLMLQNTRSKLLAQNVTLHVTGAARRALAEVGFDAAYGARPLRRAIQREVEVPLGDALLSGAYPPGSEVVVDHRDGQFTLGAPLVSPSCRVTSQ
ncbi:MAG: ATP-dependent Clp protease ATP-binding subunit [Candidatus Sericytochromatia bacterium]|nr:ATP-dependent Clp protease ATP-binding subunit [Candidatus Sericytochromatia bacterium]